MAWYGMVSSTGQGDRRHQSHSAFYPKSEAASNVSLVMLIAFCLDCEPHYGINLNPAVPGFTCSREGDVALPWEYHRPRQVRPMAANEDLSYSVPSIDEKVDGSLGGFAALQKAPGCSKYEEQ